MSTALINRLCGIALMAALPIFLAGEFMHPSSESVHDLLLPTQVPAHVLDLGAFILLLVAMPGFYAHQALRAGRLGLLGFVLTMLYIAGTAQLLVWEAFGSPRLAADPATSYLVVPMSPTTHGLLGATGSMANGPVGFVGRFMVLAPLTLLAPIIFGIATWRARVYPRWAGIFQIASVVLLPLFIGIQALTSRLGFSNQVLGVIGLSVGAVLLGYAWGGYDLWREARPVRVESATIAPAGLATPAPETMIGG